MLAYVREHVPSRARPRCAATRSPPTAASSPATCRSSTRFLHYRMVDVSSVKELARRWYPRAYFNSPKKAGGHRALADILESVEELRYYRSTVFVPQPGPTHEAGRGRRGAPGRRLGAVGRRRTRLAAAHHGGCSSAGRAPGCDPGCRGFEPRHSPHAVALSGAGPRPARRSVVLRSPTPADQTRRHPQTTAFAGALTWLQSLPPCSLPG